jgi:hypothetical protein
MDVEIRRGRPTSRRPNRLHTAKLAEIDECNRIGSERIGTLSEEAFFAAGVAL